jgi:hypothetical protein
MALKNVTPRRIPLHDYMGGIWEIERTLSWHSQFSGNCREKRHSDRIKRRVYPSGTRLGMIVATHCTLKGGWDKKCLQARPTWTRLNLNTFCPSDLWLRSA